MADGQSSNSLTDGALWLERHIAHTGRDCLIWPFGQRAKGYGSVFIDGRSQYASRVMCEKAHGPPPPGKPWALHSCGKGHLGCVNPNHLRWGSRKDNAKDAADHGVMRGSRNGRASISEATAREILALKGIQPQRVIAERFGVKPPTVAAIHSGRNWGWL